MIKETKTEEGKEVNPEELLKEMVQNIIDIEVDYKSQLEEKDVEISELKNDHFIAHNKLKSENEKKIKDLKNKHETAIKLKDELIK